jgi:hypothetical protein
MSIGWQMQQSGWDNVTLGNLQRQESERRSHVYAAMACNVSVSLNNII